MSKHIARKERWDTQGPSAYRSIEGFTVRYEKGAWWAFLSYAVRIDSDPAAPEWRTQHERMGPFKRPRNAMVEVERHAIALRNRHGERIRVIGQGMSA